MYYYTAGLGVLTTPCVHVCMCEVLSMLTEPEMADAGDEVFVDADKAEEEEENGKEETPVEVEKDPQQQQLQGYDFRKRDPQFAEADTTCLWELVSTFSPFAHTLVPLVPQPRSCLCCLRRLLCSIQMQLQRHFHPSVRKFAVDVLNGKSSHGVQHSQTPLMDVLCICVVHMCCHVLCCNYGRHCHSV